MWKDHKLNPNNNPKYVTKTGAVNIAFFLGSGGQIVTTVIKLIFASNLGTR